MILTNQFSVTRHIKSESETIGIPPGIFFSYELAPVMVKYTERQRWDQKDDVLCNTKFRK